MKIQVLQHVPFEGLGSIQSWIDARDATVQWTRQYDAPRFPDLAEIDGVIALGGPMSVNDEVEYPWLVGEKRFIAAAIAAGKPVLGICLGAQLIANALGARVYPNRLKEIGWFEIEAASTDPGAFRFPDAIRVFHWHGETFDLPNGARLLARSRACENQAFQIGRNVIGLQFHLETTPVTAETMLQHCSDELTGGEFVQTAAAMRETPSDAYRDINALMDQVLNYVMR